MPNVYIERRGAQYVAIEEGRTEPLARGQTQEEVIARAHELRPGVKLDVERVRERTEGGPDKWRSE
ncbi:MAG: hypothetical protein JO199_13085 [Candidatus Eremiobacteraeota bacterium]|nr:hypothetical protein [Candidatus Eremiobacteraeota bacterium]